MKELFKVLHNCGGGGGGGENVMKTNKRALMGRLISIEIWLSNITKYKVAKMGT